jgi:hypothetical protein
MPTSVLVATPNRTSPTDALSIENNPSAATGATR